MDVKISDKSCSIKHSGKLLGEDIGIFRLTPGMPLIWPFSSTGREWGGKLGRPNTCARFGGLFSPCRDFCHFAFSTLIHTGKHPSRELVGSLSSAGLAAAPRQTAPRGRPRTLLARRLLQHRPTQHPGFTSTTALGPQPFTPAHPPSLHHSQSPFPLSKVIKVVSIPSLLRPYPAKCEYLESKNPSARQ